MTAWVTLSSIELVGAARSRLLTIARLSESAVL